MNTTAGIPANPFPGLRPFREGEEHLFFGREAQVDTIVDRLASARLLAVVGSSGAGKSSLVNCGLIPALYRGLLASAGSAWRVAIMRPGNRPITALATTLAAALADAPASSAAALEDGASGAPTAAATVTGDDESYFTAPELTEATLRMSKLGVLDVYEMAQTQQNLLLVVDQFEELFRYRALANAADAAAANAVAARADSDRTAFVNLLLEAAAQRELPVYVVLTMRSDFLGECAQFFGLPEAINRGQYLVPRMTRDERRAAIAGPAGVSGGAIEPVLLTRLVNDVGDDPDQLSILQHALNRTWAEWQRDGASGPVSMPHYDRIGTMAQALDAHADEAFALLADEAQRRLCETLFRAITDRGTDARGTRRPTRVDTLLAISGATLAELTSVVDVFREPSRSFLMPPAGRALGADTPIDISHESLMRVWERLRGWVDDEAQSAQTYRRLAETAELSAAGKAGLLQPPDLQFATAWRVREKPNEAWAGRYHRGLVDTLIFLERSERAYDEKLQGDVRERAKQSQLAEQQRRTRRLLVRVISVVAFLSIVVGALLMMYFEAQDASDRAKLETARALTAEREARDSQKRAEEALAAERRAKDTQETYARAYADATKNEPQVRAAVAKALQEKSLIYLQIADASQRAAAERLRGQLQAAGYSAPGVEQVKAAPSRPELRYFRETDAREVSAIIGQLKRWGLVNVGDRLIAGYATKTKLKQFELWLPAEDARSIETLAAQLDNDSAQTRKAAGQALQDRYAASPRAIEAVLELLESRRDLSANGRINALYFLSRTAPLAWDDTLAARGRAVVARMQKSDGLGPQTKAELTRFERVLDTAQAMSAEPAGGTIAPVR